MCSFSLRSFSFHLWVQNFLVFKLFFNVHIESWDSRNVWHQLTDYSRIGLPFFFTFSLVILPEKVVRSEDWELNFCYGTVRAWCTQNVMRKTIYDTWTTRLKVTVPFVNLWPNTQEAYKTSFLKVNQVFSIGGSTFSVNNDWVPELINLWFFLSVHNLF